ncbi:hypothetical protein PFLUV_G00171100 [Perca fluviatilis]|uniref:C-type lectin domain-containing protein n=2 Tax=Perca fluviatilis TaxID=8168 RepID=A0A6A5EJL6_PERFL|nr:hypothetical protein PFLUV_G00171100 [Perca fluviatilis]
MADYYNEREQDSSALWIKEPVAVSLSAVSRFRRWLFPALTATFILVLIIALGASSSAESMCCPPGWDEFGSSCYFFSRESRSWNESRVWCEKRNAHLLILQDDKTWNFVTRRTVPLMYWVGLSDWRTGRWEWINQTPYTMERRRWVPGQPDSWTDHGLGPGDEDCAHLHNTGRLNDLHCSIAMRYICQKHGTQA